ncbi:hypothetical protein M9H77_17506 [Catharanthus roseus]|uniref:Uncharacterized protein n=1 Tax=Catharanthus roseus TaxID=4058 RepID=A0ACC0B4S3_CATRO|nr:hypothetical protein M9H77_17506 [Catharanthus roseus]
MSDQKKESAMEEKRRMEQESFNEEQDVIDPISNSLEERFNLNLSTSTTCGTKLKHGMEAKVEGMGKELSIGYEDTSISLSLNPFLLCHDFSFKELNLFLDFDLALDVDHMLKCSSPCAYLDKQLLDSFVRIKPSYHDLKLLHDNIFFHILVANFSSSCVSMRSKIHIFFGSFVESGYDERVSWFSWPLYGVSHVKLRGEFVKIVIICHLSFMLL